MSAHRSWPLTGTVEPIDSVGITHIPCTSPRLPSFPPSSGVFNLGVSSVRASAVTPIVTSRDRDDRPLSLRVPPSTFLAAAFCPLFTHIVTS